MPPPINTAAGHGKKQAGPPYQALSTCFNALGLSSMVISFISLSTKFTSFISERASL
jgi:hypothetical protein